MTCTRSKGKKFTTVGKVWWKKQNYWVGQEVLRFLSKNKRHIFHFHQEPYWATYSPFCSTTFCHFSSNVIIPSSQNVLSFWAKNCSGCLLQSSRELKFFPLREFCEDRNEWKSEGACLVNMADESELPSQVVTPFAWSSKATCGLVLSWCKIIHFLLTNSRHFSLSAVFSWSN